MKKIRENLNIYNAYEPGLFGLHHSLSELKNLRMTDVGAYEQTRKHFIAHCNRLGSRVLYALNNNCALVTPEPVNPYLLNYMSRILGVNGSVLALDVIGTPGDELPERILDNGRVMDRLKKWSRRAYNPILQPRTISPATIVLAQQLNISHAHVLPAGVFNREIDGIFPTLKYIESHPAQYNNSKVRNFLLMQEVDKALGTNFSPEGGVAFDPQQLLQIVKILFSQGKHVMLKADLSVDGMGNIHLDPNQRIHNGKRLIESSDLEKLTYILSQIQQKRIPFGKKAGLVVSEFLTDKIYDPSIEIYSPPRFWGVDPQIYYTCGMLIEDGGFAGSIINDPALMRNSTANIPRVIQHRQTEYRNILKRVSEAARIFTKISWKDGYVGISDCDIAICVDSNTGKLYAKILEFNYNRETGGTAPYFLKQRIDGMTGANGFVIARDTVEGSTFAKDLPVVIALLSKTKIGYTAGNSGAIVLGHQTNGGKGKIMSLVYGKTIEDVIRYDAALQKIKDIVR